jgi:AcrR family transcriptional regulator
MGDTNHMTGRSVGKNSVKVGRGRPGYDVVSLVSSSVEVFTAKGFDGASMEDLSKHLGISKSAIYHHVASKDELLELALDRALGRLAEVVALTQKRNLGSVEQLEFLIRATVAVLIDELPFVTLLLRVRGNTDVERRALERRRLFDNYLAALVARAAGDGRVRPELDPALAARMIFGLVNSLTDWVRPDGDVEVVADTVCLIALHGLLAPPTPGSGPDSVLG